MIGHSKGAGLKTLMVTHHLRCKAARRIFFPEKSPPVMNDQRIVGIILSHICQNPPPPQPPPSAH